jgi:putative hydrolase of the HAD superfamily
LIGNFQFALIDLDNTIYPQSCGLMKEIGNRINRFMVERLGMHPEAVSQKRDEYFRSHGTTLSALRHYYDIDPDEFLAFVHDIPLANYLHYDPALDEMLGRLEIRKLIFTNADAPHARRVLSRLGILRHFESILDIHFLEFVNKPNRRAYFRVLEEISAGPAECLLIEDSLANILAAGKLGMTTIMVGGERRNGAHYHLERIIDLERLAAQLNANPFSRPAGSGEIPAEARSETKPEFPEPDD